MEKVMTMTYSSSLTDLVELKNSSFAHGVLRICYHGDNRNNSHISKEVLERCIPTLYNCPIVCHYDRETDEIGGHDFEIIRDKDGTLRMVNLTVPVGVIPSTARTWFDMYEEDDGTIHEYLYTEALIWKRQEAYRKIKENGSTDHSMEITIKSGEMIDGVYHINDFEFTAFALIGVEPCFEGSALELYSAADFRSQMNEMMKEFKESFNLVTASTEVDNTITENCTEGGIKVLEDNTTMNIVADISNTIANTVDNTLMLSIDGITGTAEMDIENMAADLVSVIADTDATPGIDSENYALTDNIVSEIIRGIEEPKITREWGEVCRYWYVDCDFDVHEVYCWDTADWLLYGFTYSLDGDNVIIDFDSKKRKKYAIIDFDEGEQKSPFAEVFNKLEAKFNEASAFESKYSEANETINSLNTEVERLRKFEEETNAGIAKAARDELFQKFEDLNGVEAFELLRENCMEYELDVLEEKCYAVRGKINTSAKFSVENKTPKLKVTPTESTNEPYGGLFVKYGYESKNE